MALNTQIKLDLHIHSSESAYKEDRSVVENSNRDHLDTLFQALNNNGINLFSITDHNRFSKDLYDSAKELIAKKKYPSVLNVLAGVEFDVKFQVDKDSCHVIAIFKTSDWEEDAISIENAINNNLLAKKSDSYFISDFEDLLRVIGLPTILIAHQHTGIIEPLDNKNSTTSAVADIEGYLRFGYFDALEYNKPNVQGILLNDLVRLDLPSGTIVGSDCHEWAAYPAHDKNQPPRNPFFITAKCLPTFEGLLLSLTSPATRVSVTGLKDNANYLKAITINNVSIEFSPGINAIIGENGSGKSSLMKLMIGNRSDPSVKKILRDNEIDVPVFNSNIIEYVKQGQLQESFGSNGLFDDSLFCEISHTAFESLVNAFSETLLSKIESNISSQKNRERLKSTSVLINADLEGKTYSFSVIVDGAFTSVENEYEARMKTLDEILVKLKSEILNTETYTSEEILKLVQAREAVESVKQTIQIKFEKRQAEKQVRNFIDAAIKSYIANNRARSTDVDKEKQTYRIQKKGFADAILAVVNDLLRPEIKLPVFQLDEKEGKTINPTRGFNFSRVAKYAKNPNIQDSLISALFNLDYRDIERILSIDTEHGIIAAIPRVTNNDWKARWKILLTGFISSQEESESFITDAHHKQIGNTLGEMSLTYYKYHTQNNDDWDVFLVDQPEDNISNSRISEKLIDFINSLRYEKQVIIITHNPLLVVNQDIDNVVALEADDSGIITITSGCLESADNGVVLEKIADLMDGGHNAIRRRLRAYDSIS